MNDHGSEWSEHTELILKNRFGITLIQTRYFWSSSTRWMDIGVVQEFIIIIISIKLSENIRT